MTAGEPREQNTPGVLTLEGSCVGHNIAGRWLIGELHPSNLLETPHKLTCKAHKHTRILRTHIASWQEIKCHNWACSEGPGYWPRGAGRGSVRDMRNSTAKALRNWPKQRSKKI